MRNRMALARRRSCAERRRFKLICGIGGRSRFRALIEGVPGYARIDYHPSAE
jgi:hypothetical protein